MNRIGLIDGYEESKVRKTLNLMLRDKRNEFRELVESIEIPISSALQILKQSSKSRQNFKMITSQSSAVILTQSKITNV